MEVTRFQRNESDTSGCILKTDITERGGEAYETGFVLGPTMRF